MLKGGIVAENLVVRSEIVGRRGREASEREAGGGLRRLVGWTGRWWLVNGVVGAVTTGLG